MYKRDFRKGVPYFVHAIAEFRKIVYLCIIIKHKKVKCK